MASGGKRPGAGHPTYPVEEKRVALTAMVLPSTAERLKALASCEGGRGSGKIGRYLDKIVGSEK
jgi:hypothetical protein